MDTGSPKVGHPRDSQPFVQTDSWTRKDQTVRQAHSQPARQRFVQDLIRGCEEVHRWRGRPCPLEQVKGMGLENAH